MPRHTHVCAIAAGLFAAVGVADNRIGLALAVSLLLVVAAAAFVAPLGANRAMLVAIGAALAFAPALRDAGWVVAVDVVATLAAAGALVTAPRTWRAVARALAAPLRLIAGATLVGRATAELVPNPGGRAWGPLLRGVVLATVLLSVFGALFVTADAAFADLADQTFGVQVDAGALLWRLLLGATATAVAGALVVAARRRSSVPEPQGWAPGVLELRIALGALVALFVAFVVVQMQVLFGGPGYVQRTTGLGLGEYARQGFTQMLLVAALTLGVVAVAARRRDPVVKGLLAALCLLCLVVLVSAQHRLGLVVDAYGLTRVRVAGEAILPWLAGLLVLVLAAGAHPWVERRATVVAVTGTLAATLAFSLSNPDGRIAGRAVERHAATGQLDVDYLAGLSADAIPAVRRLPEPVRGTALERLEFNLERPDGLAGLNASRARAR